MINSFQKFHLFSIAVLLFGLTIMSSDKFLPKVSSLLNREVHQSVPGMFEEFQSQNLLIGGLNQAIYVMFTVRISIKFLMPRDISEMSPRQPNMPGLREQMLTWTETKTSLTCYCEHKLHHTQTKFR